MIDISEQRRRTMRAVRSKDTGPEWRVRRFLHALGLRYRLHVRCLPGKPDLVFPSRHVAVFVHGCFWHQHEGCTASARPRSRTEYWEPKLDRNVARDREHRAALEALGWRVLVIWECETGDATALHELAARIREHRRMLGD